MRRISVVAAAAALLLSPFAVPAPALADTEVVADEIGDGADGPDLDIIELRLRNGAKRIVVTTTYAQVANGDQIIFLKAQQLPGTIRVVSERRAGQDRDFLLNGKGEKLRCPKLSTTWDSVTSTSRVVLPAKCFHDGDYQAVKTFLLTEIGSDTDWAPEDLQGEIRFTDWIDRG